MDKYTADQAMKIKNIINKMVLEGEKISEIEKFVTNNSEIIVEWDGMVEESLQRFEDYKKIGEFNFSNLDGSEKQIKWAIDIIKNKRGRQLLPLVRNLRRGRITEEELTEEIKKYNSVSAKWWIDNR